MVWAVWQSIGHNSFKLWLKMLSLASWQSSQLQIQGTAATFAEPILRAESLPILPACFYFNTAMLVAVLPSSECVGKHEP
jgi:hypothetical protein